MIVTRFPSSPIFLLGDFNYPSIIWEGASSSINSSHNEGNSFLSFCGDFHLHQIVSSPTRITASSSNILDLILATAPDLASSVTHYEGLSDHSLLHFFVNVPVCRSPKRPKIIRNYKNANFAALNEELCLFLDDFLSDFENRSVESNWLLFKDKVGYLIEKYIPSIAIRVQTDSPWYNRRLRRLNNKKKRLYRIARTMPSPCRWDRYAASVVEYKTALRDAKKVFYSEHLPSLLKQNPKKFWSIVNKRDEHKISLCDGAGNFVFEHHCAEVLNVSFTNAFTSDTSIVLPWLPALSFSPMDSITVDCFGIKKLIDVLPVSSSAGTDRINSKFLKGTAMYSSIILTQIFKQSLEDGRLPDDWKVGKIIPLYKSGNQHNPLNFRPISLTSVPCKLLEHVIASHLIQHLESNSFFIPVSMGFANHFRVNHNLSHSSMIFIAFLTQPLLLIVFS